MKILMVLTSTQELGKGHIKTGADIEDFATAYYEFVDAGVEITIATPKGGAAAVDPCGLAESLHNPQVKRFIKDYKLQHQLANTIRLAKAGQFFYEAIFYSGGGGMIWDLVLDDTSVPLIANFYKHDKPMAFIGQGIAALLGVKDPWGELLLKDRKIAAPTGGTVSQYKHSGAVFSAESEIKRSGAKFVCDNSKSIIRDGIIITGQHGTAADAAKMMIKMLTPPHLTTHRIEIISLN